jgi:hypothetical protein
MKASENPFPSVLFDEQASDIATPASDRWVVYTKSGGVYARNAAGTVVGPFAAASGNALSVTKIRRTTAQNVSGSGTLTSISFDTEDEDTSGAWAIGTPTQIVIPAGLNGRRALAAGYMTWDSAFAAGTYRGLYLKHNSAFPGAVVVSTAGQTTLADQQEVITPYPLTLATGDTLELQMRINTTLHGCATATFCLWTVD